MSIRGPGFWGYRWEGYSHQELYDQVTKNVKGAAAIGGADQAWMGFVDLMNRSKDATEKLLRDAGGSWQGPAAESMSEGVSPLAGWAQRAATAGEASKTSIHQVADSFTHAANSMPEPVPVPSKASQGIPTTFTELIGGQADEDLAEQRSQASHQHAVELMNSYTATSMNAADTMGTFSEPDHVGVSVSPQGSLTRSDGGVIDSRSFEDSGGPGGPGGGPGGSGGGSGAPGGYSPYPGVAAPPGTGGQSSGTDASRAVSPAPVGGPSPNPISPNSSATPNNSFTPITGVLPGPVAGRPSSSGRSGGIPGGGGRIPGGPGATGGPGASGPGASGPRTGGPGRGGLVGSGPLAAAEAAAARGAAATGARGGGPAGAFGPMGAGAARGDDDKDRNAPEYLRDFNDDFWDDTPPVAPPVIGEDDD